MYNEKNDGFSFRNMILQFLFIALFIFILIWLFPMKSDLKKLISENGTGGNTTDLSMFYDQIFNNNVVAMKDAAKSYFTTERLPKNVWDKVSITLREMLDKKIILPFVDSKGKQCDLDDSYVDITKDDNEFVMKVNLKCPESDQENYLLVYMGCYDYCQTSICEKNTTDVKTPVVHTPENNRPIQNIVVNPPAVNIPDIIINNNITNNNTNVNINNNQNNNGGGTVTPPPEEPDKPDPEPDNKEYICEYVKNTVEYTAWSSWSSWQSTYPSYNDLVQVKYRDVTKKTLIGYNVKTVKDLNNPIWGTRDVVVGKVTKTICDSYKKVTSGGTVTYGDWVYDHELTTEQELQSNNLTLYVPVTDRSYECNDYCSSGLVHTYKVYKRNVTSSGGNSTYTCASTKTIETLVHSQQNYVVGYKTKQEKEPVYKEKETREYSYRTRSYKTTPNLKWSNCSDTTLLNNGYKLTGNKKEK